VKIRGVLGMLDTPSRDGLTLGSECTDVRGYRPVPLWAYGGRMRGMVDRFWPDGKTLRFEATMPDDIALRAFIVDKLSCPSMALTGEPASSARWKTDRWLPDWEMHRVELVLMERGKRPWPECSVELDEEGRPMGQDPLIVW